MDILGRKPCVPFLKIIFSKRLRIPERSGHKIKKWRGALENENET